MLTHVQETRPVKSQVASILSSPRTLKLLSTFAVTFMTTWVLCGTYCLTVGSPSRGSRAWRLTLELARPTKVTP